MLEITQILNVLLTLAFTVGLTLVVLRLAYRLGQYKGTGVRVPSLFYRDIILFAGLATPFLLILGVRAVSLFVPEITAFLRANLLWSLITAVPAIGGVWYWLYYEWFKIDKIGRKK